jgi:hypothetical protein
MTFSARIVSFGADKVKGLPPHTLFPKLFNLFETHLNCTLII